MEIKSIISTYEGPTGDQPVGPIIPARLLPDYDPDNTIIATRIIDLGIKKDSR